MTLLITRRNNLKSIVQRVINDRYKIAGILKLPVIREIFYLFWNREGFQSKRNSAIKSSLPLTVTCNSNINIQLCSSNCNKSKSCYTIATTKPEVTSYSFPTILIFSYFSPRHLRSHEITKIIVGASIVRIPLSREALSLVRVKSRIYVTRNDLGANIRNPRSIPRSANFFARHWRGEENRTAGIMVRRLANDHRRTRRSAKSLKWWWSTACYSVGGDGAFMVVVASRDG